MSAGAAYQSLVRPLHYYTQMETPMSPSAGDLQEAAWDSWEQAGEYEDSPWQQ